MNHAIATLETPLGRYSLTASEQGMTHLQLAGSPKLPQPGGQPSDAALRQLERARDALEEYFAGARKRFDDLTLAPSGSPFQQLVWNALLEIPFGQTESYGGLARRIGRPGAARAVGLANHENPIGIVIPCHRVIGSDGSLTGYAGGLNRKRWLLAHEGSLSCDLFEPA